MKSFAVFSITSGTVTVGAVISTIHLKGAGIDIPVIVVGEEGRGRERGVIPVGNPPIVPCLERGKDLWVSRDTCDKCGAALDEKIGNTRHHPHSGTVTGRLMFAEIGETKTGKAKFFSKDSATTDKSVIVVFNTKIGFRGGNSHTGDRIGWKCSKYGCDAVAEGAINVPEVCPKCGGDTQLSFAKFPGEIIAKGTIAEGAAGRAGSGEQIIAIVPKNIVFRTVYSGRLYGAPAAHYYMWDGLRLLSATWDERASSDLF